MGLLEQSAVASLSVRAIGPRTDLGEGYVTLGAGNRARVDRDRAGDAVDAGERSGPTPAPRSTGPSPATTLGRGRAVAGHRGRAGRRRPPAVRLGARRHGPGHRRRRPVRGGHRQRRRRPADGVDERHREAALAMMDDRGRVAGGTVWSHLTVVDPAAPGGRRMDPSPCSPRSTPPGRPEPATPCWWRCRTWSAPTQRPARRRAGACGGPGRPPAAGRRLLGQLLERVDLSRDRVIVVSPAAPGGFGRLTMFAMAGAGSSPAWPAAPRPAGTASSPSPTSARRCSTRSACSYRPA